MKYVRLLCRMILGIVFVFSGFVKAVDPLGSAYKFADYFSAFKLGFLEFLTLPLGIFLSAFELLLGMILILGYRRKIAYLVLMWFMSFFTLLTFILAIFNPVSDCGCFGDALILTNWQTFFKNVLLMGMVLPLYMHRQNVQESEFVFREWIAVLGLFVMASGFSYWNYRHIPLIDFRPYQVGTVIVEGMKVPEGAPLDQYETTLVYRNKKTGKSESFQIDNYPKDTLGWEFVNSESRLVKKGSEPPIHDFAIMDKSGTDLVDEILADKGYSLVLISDKLSKANKEALQNVRGWSQLEILAGDFSFYAVTATPSVETESLSASLNLGYNFLAGDEIMLKTIVRSNPGFMLIKNGTILGKWGYRDFPSIENLDPEWSELIGNASAPLDEEAQLLMEAGVYEEFSFDVVDFDRFLPELLYKKEAQKRERGVLIVFILGMIILLFISPIISPIRV
ncbi:MAG: BT_3928 family protein [Bacteroidota bacterium]